jgi:hypothetical protein
MIRILSDEAFRMRKLYPLLVAVAMTACASDPASKAAPASQPAAPTPVAASAPAAPAAPEQTVAAESATESGVYIAPAGYQKKVRGSKTLYCKSDTPVGTRFAKEYCYTQQDLERMEASRSNSVQDVERARRTCTGGGCGGG